MQSSINLICPDHKTSIVLDETKTKYVCPYGCIFTIKDNIPRFVPLDNYCSSFGLQWNRYRMTQLDSYTGLTISRDRLTRLMGGSLEILKEEDVLEAGCGAGRFTEIMLEAGANVFAADISAAVEANYKNCSHYRNYFICQADILNLPVKPGSFDIVVCIGVIQHTPNPEETISALISYLKPGGLLVMDHYTYGYPVTLSRRILRSILIRMPAIFSLHFSRLMTELLWPMHWFLWKVRNDSLWREIHQQFLKISPVVDYHYSYNQLGPDLLRAWAILDTHDTLTDRFKHLRSADEIKLHLKKMGMSEIETYYAGNGVEARAKKSLKWRSASEDVLKEIKRSESQCVVSVE